MKKVNLWKTLFLSALAVAAFTGCSNDDSDEGGGMPSITVNGAETARVAVGLNGGKTEAVTIESSGDWTITFEGSDIDDCVAVPATGGKGSTSVYFELGSRTADRTITAKVVTYGSIEGLSVPVPASVTITILQNSDGSTEVKTNVADIRAKLKAMTTTSGPVTDELAAMTLTGIVVSDASGQNMASGKSAPYYVAVQDASTAAGSGLTVHASAFKTLNPTPGMVLEVSLKDAQISYFNDVLQLKIDDGQEISTSQTEPLDPVTITADKILDYESMFVKIENCQPNIDAVGTTWDGNKDFEILPEKATTFEVRTGSAATFKDEKIPEKSGYLLGIASQYQGKAQIMPRTSSDFNGLTGEYSGPEYKTGTISQIAANEYWTVSGSIVSLYTRGFLVADNSGYVLVYFDTWTSQTSNTYEIGQKVTLKGKVEQFPEKVGLLQFASPSITTDGTESFNPGEATTFDAAGLTAYESNMEYKYVTLSGVLSIVEGSSSTSGKYYSYTVAVSGYNSKKVTLAYAFEKDFAELESGDVVDVTGYAIGTNLNQDAINIMATSVVKNTSTAAVTITTTPTSFSADGGTQDIAFTVANAGSNKTYAKIEGTGFSVPTGEVTSPVKVTAEANTGEAREAKLTIYVAASENGAAVAEASVTLKQLGVAPSGTEIITLTIDNIVSGKNGSVELGSGSYGSQDANNESTWYTWSASSINFSGARITQGNGKDGAYNNSVLQMQGSSSGKGFVLNTSSLGEIVSIKVICQNSKESNKPGYHMYFGTEKNPSGNEMSCSSTVTGSGSVWSFTDTFDVSGKGYGYFKLYNNSSYALYVKSIEITYKK